MRTATALLARALAAHRAGQIARAAAGYREVLDTDPGHSRACHLLGFALLQLGQPAQAEPMLTDASRRLPASPDAWAHLGLALQQLGRRNEAGTALRRAQLLAPTQRDAAAGLRDLAVERNAPVADRLARHALALAPGEAAGWHRLGLYRARRASDESTRADADTLLRRAVLLSPRDVPAVTDLADVRRARREPDSACRFGRWALRLHPGSAAARVTLAAVLLDLDRSCAARTAARAAAVLHPSAAEAYANLAQCLYADARFELAVRAGRQASRAAPGDPRLRANLATYHLSCGDLERGWALFRHRPSARLAARRPGLPAARWAGEPSPGLLVLAEQGLGDELLFASCWPDLAERVRRGDLGTVVVELDPRLRPLAERSFPELRWKDRLGNGEQQHQDITASHWIAAGDLPTLFRRRLDDFPSRAGYLAVDPERVAGFRRWLDAEAPHGRRLGLCWRSGLRTAVRRKYYPGLADCLPLQEAADVRLVALQYDDFIQELTEAWPADAPALLVPPGLDRRDDLDGAAALMAALDGVLTADTSVLSLAGATGAPTIAFGRRPTWVALGQDQPPWYRSVTTIHLRPDETWSAMMRRIAEDGPVPSMPAAGGRKKTGRPSRPVP